MPYCAGEGPARIVPVSLHLEPTQAEINKAASIVGLRSAQLHCGRGSSLQLVMVQMRSVYASDVDYVGMAAAALLPRRRFFEIQDWARVDR
jgi:hypothetical protein